MNLTEKSSRQKNVFSSLSVPYFHPKIVTVVNSLRIDCESWKLDNKTSLKSSFLALDSEDYFIALFVIPLKARERLRFLSFLSHWFCPGQLQPIF